MILTNSIADHSSLKILRDINPKPTYYTEIIICLFDKEYHYGIAALANSLVASNFNGLINVGFRGRLPSWVSQLKTIGDNYFYLTTDIIIHFNQLDTDMHLGYYKPFFIKETMDTYKTTDKFYYFDADILIRAPWHIFSSWLDKGVCICLDSNFHFLHHNHPWRKDWRKLVEVHEKLLNNTHYYFNSGFLGIERQSIDLIKRWIHFTVKYKETGGDVNQFEKAPYSSFKGDQDLLNAAITTSADIEISIMGKEGMGFTYPATIMEHAVGDDKPWNKSFLGQLITIGRKPSMADQAYFSFCKYPICIFPVHRYRFKKLKLLTASILGRFLG